MSFIIAKRITKRYDEGTLSHTAVCDVSFELSRGEFAVLQGPSGCGKSTLLHLLGGMDRVTEGEIVVNGRCLANLSRDELAQVKTSEDRVCFPDIQSAADSDRLGENAYLPLSLDARPEIEARERGLAALEEVGMGHRAEYLPAQLSGGELQRVAIARAVTLEPELLVADEPTGNLDSANGRQVLELLRRLNETRGLTVIMATHSEDAAAYATRTLRMRDGRLDNLDVADAVSETV